MEEKDLNQEAINEVNTLVEKGFIVSSKDVISDNI